MFLNSFLIEMKHQLRILAVFSDSQAALDSLVRGGVGRMRHVGMRALFMQELVKRKMVSVRKVKGEENCADLLTKHLAATVITKLLGLLPLSLEPPALVKSFVEVVVVVVGVSDQR